MRITEKTNEGLKRGYVVTTPADEVARRHDTKLDSVVTQIRMPGFRPGKVPRNLVAKMHGQTILGEILNELARESIETLLKDQGVRPAAQPQVELEDYVEGKDVSFNISLEILPGIDLPGIDGFKLEKLVVKAGEDEMQAALEDLASNQKQWVAADASHQAEKGDLVVLDFVGHVDGEVFEGGKGEGMQVELGSGRLIPGFEDGLIGLKAGDDAKVKATFPADYHAPYLCGREAEFDVHVTEVRCGETPAIDESLATSLGLESLAQLRELLQKRLEGEMEGLSHTYLKRQILDHLANAVVFDVPPSMLEAEFSQIWEELQKEAREGDDPDTAIAEIEAEKDVYHGIAERRVRLGLLLSEIGQANDVRITPEEMEALVMREAGRYPPDQRPDVVRFFRENSMAAAQLRAPLYEDRVIDLILGKAELSERAVERDELEAAIADDADTSAKSGAKKAPARKRAATKAPAAKTPAAAKKAPAKSAAAKAPAAAKKAPAKSAAAKAPAAAKKAPAKSAAAKAPAAAKKAPARKTPTKDA